MRGCDQRWERGGGEPVTKSCVERRNGGRKQTSSKFRNASFEVRHSLVQPAARIARRFSSVARNRPKSRRVGHRNFSV